MNKKILSIVLSTALLGQTVSLVSAKPLVIREDDYSTTEKNSLRDKEKKEKKHAPLSTVRPFVRGTLLGAAIPTTLYLLLSGSNSQQNVVLKQTPTNCMPCGEVRLRAIEPHDNMDGLHSSILLFYYSSRYFDLIHRFPLTQAKELLNSEGLDLQTRTAFEAMICFSEIINAIYGSAYDPSAQSPQVVSLNPKYERKFIDKLNAFCGYSADSSGANFTPLKYGEKRNPCTQELDSLINYLATNRQRFSGEYLPDWCEYAYTVSQLTQLDNNSINEREDVNLRIIEESGNYYLQINLTDQQNNTSSWTIGNGPDAKHAITDMQYLVDRRSAEGNSSFGAPSAPPAEMFG